MSDLTRSSNTLCYRCGCMCDAYMHTSNDGNQFCTFYCANQYHSVTGTQILGPSGTEILKEERPKYQVEYEDDDIAKERVKMYYGVGRNW
jgi:hypothetical protein